MDLKILEHCHPGCDFLVRSMDKKDILDDIIVGVQNWVDPVKSIYSHGGIIHNSTGKTWEQRKRLGFYDLRDYAGDKILIARRKKESEREYERVQETYFAFMRRYAVVKKNKLGMNAGIGRIYPVMRLLLFIVPPLARKMNIGLRVCTEESSFVLCQIGERKHWKGVYPGRLEAMFKNWEAYDVLYEGVCE